MRPGTQFKCATEPCANGHSLGLCVMPLGVAHQPSRPPEHARQVTWKQEATSLHALLVTQPIWIVLTPELLRHIPLPLDKPAPFHSKELILRVFTPGPAIRLDQLKLQQELPENAKLLTQLGTT